MNQRDPEKPPRFCLNCGAKTVPGLSHCTACGHSLLQSDELARLWGRDADASRGSGEAIIDLYPTIDMSSQATTPFTQTRPFDPHDFVEATAAKPSTRTKQAGASSAGVAPGRPAAIEHNPPRQTTSGPPGFVLGCLAILLIALVGILLAWGAIRPLVSDRIEQQISVGIANELRQIDPVSVPTDGRIRLTAAQINTSLAGNDDLLGAISDVVVAIDRSEIVVEFDMYGLPGSFRGGLSVEAGRLQVTDPSLQGPASRIVDTGAVAAVFEDDVAELLRRSNVRPTGVRLQDGAIVISTATVAIQ